MPKHYNPLGEVGHGLSLLTLQHELPIMHRSSFVMISLLVLHQKKIYSRGDPVIREGVGVCDGITRSEGMILVGGKTGKYLFPPQRQERGCDVACASSLTL